MSIHSALLILALAFAPNRGDAGNVEEAYYRAFYLESALRDFEAAAAAYGDAAALATGDAAKFLAPALAGKGRCLQARGQLDAARAAFEAALRADPNNAEAKRALEPQPSDGVDPELRARIRALIEQLAGPEAENAEVKLKTLGPVTLPFLEEALRSRDVGVVSRASGMMPWLGGAAAAVAMERALSDPQVVLAHVLAMHACNAIQSESYPIETWLAFAEATIAHADSRVRRSGSSVVRYWSNRSGNSVPDRVVAALERCLADPDSEVRRIALADLSTIPLERVAPSVAAIATGNDSGLRRMAIERIALCSPTVPTLVAAVVTACEDVDAGVRASAAGTLLMFIEKGRLELSPFVELLTRLLGDEIATVTVKAARALSKNSGPLPRETTRAAIAALVRALAEPDSGNAQNATGVLVELIRRLEPGNRELDDAWEAFGKLRDGDSRLGYGGQFVKNALEPVEGDAAKVTLLVRLFEPAPDLMRQVWIVQQGRNQFRDDRVVAPLLARLAGSQHSMIRRDAYSWIESSKLSDVVKDSLPHLIEDVASSDEKLADSAFRALLLDPRPEHAAPAIRFLEANPGKTPTDAIAFLVRCAGKESIPTLLATVAGRNSSLAKAAAKELADQLEPEQAEDLYRAIAEGPTTRSNSPLLPFLVEGPDRWYLRATQPALLEQYVLVVPRERWTGKMLSYLEQSRDHAMPAIVDAALAHADAEVRAAGCKLAQSWNLESTEPALLRLLDDASPSVAHDAQNALAELRFVKELRATTKLSLDFDRSKAIEEARQLLTDPDAAKRRGGALALGALDDLAAIPLLLKLLDDKDPGVRDAALAALSKLGASPKPSGGD